MRSLVVIHLFELPNNVFDFDILIEETVDNSLIIPKLLIQNFVENAIYHGLIPRKKDGLLTIKINQDKKNISIIIEDNGIGREASQKHEGSTGKGIKLLKNYFDLLNKNNSEHLTFEITDLYKNEKPAGTKVELRIPINFRYT